MPQAVPTNTSVISVRGHTLFPTVTFVTKASNPVVIPQLPSPSPRTLPTPVRVERLSFLLNGYTHSTVEFLISGFMNSFPIHFQGVRQSRKAKNLLSALDNPSAVDSKLKKELEAQQLAGPLSVSTTVPILDFPLGCCAQESAW